MTPGCRSGIAHRPLRAAIAPSAHHENTAEEQLTIELKFSRNRRRSIVALFSAERSSLTIIHHASQLIRHGLVVFADQGT